MKNSNWNASQTTPPDEPVPTQEPVPEPKPAPEEQLAATAIGLNYAGYAAQAAKVAVAWNAKRRVWRMANANMSYAITKQLHGNTFRARPLVIGHLFSNGAVPKVGVQSTSSPETHAPDGQTINVLVPQWRNGADIAGATTVNYTPVAGDVGKYLSVAMTPSTAARPGIAFSAYTGGKVAA